MALNIASPHPRLRLDPPPRELGEHDDPERRERTKSALLRAIRGLERTKWVILRTVISSQGRKWARNGGGGNGRGGGANRAS